MRRSDRRTPSGNANRQAHFAQAGSQQAGSQHAGAQQVAGAQQLMHARSRANRPPQGLQTGPQAGSQHAGAQQARRARSRWNRPPHGPQAGAQTGSQQAGSQTAGSQQAGSQTAGSQQAGSQTAGAQQARRARNRWNRPPHGPQAGAQTGSQQAGSQQAGSQHPGLPNKPAWAPEAAMATTAAATNTGRRIRRFMGDALLKGKLGNRSLVC